MTSKIRFVTFMLVSALGVAEAPTAQTMTAGVARGVITNAESLVMVNGRMSEGTKEDIHARVLVLNDGSKRLVFVTYDLNCLDVATPILRQRVNRDLGIPSSHLILLATHNHNAPIQINPDNFAYGRQLAGQMFDLISEAIADERGPVQVEFGSGYGYFITARGNAPVDYEVQLLQVTQNQAPIAMLFNHGTHPAQASRSLIDAGHPGYAMDEIEATFPGVLALYSDASGGNQFPRLPADWQSRVDAARDEGAAAYDALLEAQARKLGHELAKVVISIANGPLEDVSGPITSSIEVVSLPLALPISRAEAQDLLEELPPDIGFVPYPHPHRSSNWVRMLLRYYDEGIPFPTKTTEMVCTDDTYLIHTSDQEFLDRYDDQLHDTYPCIYNEVIVAKLGPMPIVAMQGEICAPIGARIKDEFRHDRPIMVFGYMGEHNLYIPTRELVRLDAYQAQVIQIQYASPVGWAPEVEDDMVGHVVRMVKTILN
ncbi:MAG: hypothetical protein CL484_10465 [Acidobacteria bacterium]|nr:hypothetical protein [Acidobacteriota bacterium]